MNQPHQFPSNPDLTETTLGAYLQSKYASQFLSSGSSEESPRWTQPYPVQQSDINASQSFSMHLTSKSVKDSNTGSGNGPLYFHSSAQETFAAELETIYARQLLHQPEFMINESSEPTARTIKAIHKSPIRQVSNKVMLLQDAMSTTKITSIDRTLATFVERLALRQRLQDVNENLTQIESMLLTLLSQDPTCSELYNSILQKHSLVGIDHQTFGGTRTHVQALKQVELLANTIQNSFREYMHKRQDFKSCNHNQRSPGDHFADKDHHMLLLSEVEPCSVDSPEQVAAESFGVNRRRLAQSDARGNTSVEAINPFVSNRSVEMKDKSVTTNDSNNSVAIRDQIRQATALQDQLNLEEIRLCNELIERLKQENAKLEFQVVEQKSEISVLTNQINEMQGTAGARLSSMDKKEIEGLIKRLREDLDKTKAERRANDLKVVESEQVIAKLSAQIRELKQRLTSRDDVLSGEQQMLLAQKAKELNEMRQENLMMTQRYQDLAQVLKQKEIEIFTLEERSKTLLQAAQRDAEECIAYFKGLACQKSQEPDGANQRKGSTSREREQFASNVSFNPATPRSFPQSLAPITSRPTVQRTKMVSPSKPQQRAKPERTNSNHREIARSLSPNTSPKILGKTAPLRRPLEAELEKCGDVVSETAGFASQLKMELALNSLSRAFQEIAETKAGISSFVQTYQESYCEQLQQFSVLAYDYIEQIENIYRREAELEDRVKEEQERVEKLKTIALDQSEHIRTQSHFIQSLKQCLSERQQEWERGLSLKDTERMRLVRICNEELPSICQSLNKNVKSIDSVFSAKIQSSHELSDVRSAHQMLKSKVRILEEELEKALVKCRSQEEVQNSEKAKMDRLTDLIKDIWTVEVQQTMTQKPSSQFATMASYHANGLISGRGQTTNRASATLQHADQSEKKAFQAYILVPDVPTPVSWLSDIADHIKQLKEMNDLQRDEVYQLYLVLNKHQTHSNPANASLTGSSSNSESSAKAAQPSSEDGYVISENEVESTQNHNSSLKHDEEELSERISERNLKMLQQQIDPSQVQTTTFPHLDKKEMSFSHRLSDEVSTESDGKKVVDKRRILSATERPLNSTKIFKRKQPTFANDPRSFSQERQKRGGLQAKSRNLSANVLKDDPTSRVGTSRIDPSVNYFAAEYSPRLLMSRQPRPGKMTQAGASPVTGEHSKRNELYAMLHEEVNSLLRQVNVGKETVFQMKGLIKQKQGKLNSLHCEMKALAEQKGQVESQLRMCEDALKSQEQQTEELQIIIDDKDDAIETLKSQIEDFEKELSGLQDQISHVMKLNAEISAASEHWEKSYHEQVQANSQALSVQEHDFKSMQKQMTDRLHQFKKKLASKDSQLKEANHQLEQINNYLEGLNQIKMSSMSVSTNTGPEFELLEKQNQVLKDQLTQVKDDIAAVLDQYESEQVNNKSLNDLLHTERATNGSLANELNKVRMENGKLGEHVMQLQGQIMELEKAIDNDQAYYKEQMQHAQEINEQLQHQVEAVTQLTEELQEQIQLTSRSNNELVQRSEKVENQRKFLEFKLQTYTRQISESNDLIQQLQAKLDRLRSQKRETRSFSISRMQSRKNYKLQKEEEHNGISQVVENDERSRMIPTSMHSSGSKLSASPVRNKKQTAFDRNIFRKQEEVMLATNSSIFDEDVEAEAVAALNEGTCFKRNQAATSGNVTTLSGTCKSSELKKVRDVPALKGHKEGKGRRKRADRSISPIIAAQQVSTHTGTTAITGLVSAINVHQNSNSSNCCCQGRVCKNQAQSMERKATEESNIKFTEESTFREVKAKNDATQYAKKKVKKLLKMVEDLVRHYCVIAKDRNDHRMLAQGRQLQSDASSTLLTSTNEVSDLQAQLKKWNSQSTEQMTATEKKQRRDRAIHEAKAFFNKKSPSLMACLSTLAENYNPNPGPMIFEQPIKQTKIRKQSSKKEPPQIVSSFAKGEVDLQTKNCSYIETETEISDIAATKSCNNSASSNMFAYKRPSRGSDGRNQASSKFDALNKRNSRSRSNDHEGVNIISIATHHKSPTSNGQQATATFRAQLGSQDLSYQCRLLFSKLNSFGRSLAGICFGGCIFMAHQIPESAKQQVDFALQLLAGEISETDAQDRAKLEETTKILEGLLQLVSQMFTISCRNSLKSEGKQNFASVDLSMENENSMNKDLTSKRQTSNQQHNSQGAQHSLVLATQVRDRLLDLEHKMKSKSSHINQLEQTLDNLLNPRSSQKISETQAIENLCQNPDSLLKVLQNLKRAIAKLKIELHADYLVLGQVNIQCQTSREHSSAIEAPSTLPFNFASVGSFAPSVAAPQSQIQSAYRDLESQFYQQVMNRDQMHMSTNSPYVSSCEQTKSGHQRYSQYSGASLPLLASIQGSNLQRQGSVSSQKTAAKNQAIERIVEELKGLTFEI